MPGAEAVLFAHGHKFGGHALYIKDGKLKYVYNYLGEIEQMITSNLNVPKGKCVLGVEFAKEKLQGSAMRRCPTSHRHGHPLYQRPEGRRVQGHRDAAGSSRCAAKD